MKEAIQLFKNDRVSSVKLAKLLILGLSEEYKLFHMKDLGVPAMLEDLKRAELKLDSYAIGNNIEEGLQCFQILLHYIYETHLKDN